MPMYETPVPVGGYSVKAVKKSRDYPLEAGVATFTRSGKDGNKIIAPICGGCEFVGEVLPGEFKKGWTAEMDADQAFVALIDGGLLKLKGEADNAGTFGYGWIDGQHPIPLMDETEVTVELEVPISDTGTTADRDISFYFYLLKNKITTVPHVQADLIRIQIEVSESGLIMYFTKKIGGTYTNVFSGSTYDDASSQSETAEKFTIWRLVFHDGHYGESAPSDDRHVHVYLKQADTRDDAEAATENELTTSPYDISDLLFDVAYPAYTIGSQNSDYFDDGQEAISAYLRVDYPDNFDIRYLRAKTDLHKGDVELWDGDPDVATSQQVFDVDHEFGGDCYIQNGLVRWIIETGTPTQDAPLYYWSGVSWTRVSNRLSFSLEDVGASCGCIKLVKIISVSPEKVIIHLRLHEDAVDDDDYYVDCYLTLKRGLHTSKISHIKSHPASDLRAWTYYSGTKHRFGYAGNGKIGDYDLDISNNNTTMSDNFGVHLDDETNLPLITLASRIKPDSDIHAHNGGQIYFRDFEYEKTDDVELYIIITPFSLVANLFEEAEDANYGAGASVEADAAASGGQAVKFDAQNEDLKFYRVLGTASDLPSGRYLAVIRARDTNQVAGDLGLQISNTTDNQYRNEENSQQNLTLTASYDYYCRVFDITAEDSSGGDTIRIRLVKLTANANDIYIDYLLIIPIGDGEDWPQDLAHAAMRSKVQARRIFSK